MIFVTAEEYEIISSILKQAEVPFYAFGSRVTGKHRQFSDLDLCYQASIPSKVLNKIVADLEDSDLPFTVDLVDFNHCSEEFQRVISANMVEMML